MVAELDITDQDVIKIADMIDGEIALLVPEWQPGPGYDETPQFSDSNFCLNCASNHTSTGSFLNFLSNNPGAKPLQFIQCSEGCTATRGRFEEFTYRVDSPRQNGNACNAANKPSNGLHCAKIWNQNGSHECSSIDFSGGSHYQEEKMDKESSKEDKTEAIKKKLTSSTRMFSKSLSGIHTLAEDMPVDYDHKIQHELRWNQIEVQKLTDQWLDFLPRCSNHCSTLDNSNRNDEAGIVSYKTVGLSDYDENTSLKSCPSSDHHKDRKIRGGYSREFVL